MSRAKSGGFHVFTNLAMSMDGKISTKDRAHIDPSPHDRYLMDANRARAHAVLVGAATLRVYRRPALVERNRFALLRKSRGLRPNPLNVVLARTVDFDPSWPFFTHPSVERAIVVPKSTPDRALEPFLGIAHVFKYEERADFPEQIIGFLKSLGCANLLLEGGGNIMFPWVERDLIDEWNITIVPAVMGGEHSPTMVEGPGFDVEHIRRFRLKWAKRKRDELFLRYIRR